MSLLEQEPPQNPMALELTDQQFNLWRHDPVTRCFLLYLEHQADNYRLGHLARWESNKPLSDLEKSEELERVGRIAMCEDLRTVNLTAIRRLYGLKEAPGSEQRDGSGAHQGAPG